MALPGGRREASDDDLLATALREVGEEVGVTLASDSFAGTLEDVVPRTPLLPPIAVRPFVFLAPSRPPLLPNLEVADTHWVPLDDLMRPGTHRPVLVDIAGESRQVMAYQLEEAIVWGMTERILSSLVRRLND